MATRKPRNPELVAAAGHLADAAHHVREAVSQKIDAFGAAAAGELDKARQAALDRSGQAGRKFESLMKKARQQLTKATDTAKKSLHKAVRESEKKLQAMDKALQSDLAKLRRSIRAEPASAKPSKQAAAKKAPPKKAAARKTSR
jgi:uncharacterized protein (DUF885 family)